MFALLGAFVNGTLSGLRYESDLDKEGINLIRFLEHEARKHIVEGDKEEFKLIAAGVLLDPRVRHIGVYDASGNTVFSSESIISTLHHKHISSERLASNDYKVLVLDDMRHFVYPIIFSEKEEDIAGTSTIGFVDVTLDNTLIFKTRKNSFIWTFIVTTIIAILMMAIVYLYLGRLAQPHSFFTENRRYYYLCV